MRRFSLTTLLVLTRTAPPQRNDAYDMDYLHQAAMPDHVTLQNRATTADIALLGNHQLTHSAIDTPLICRAMPAHPMDSANVRVAGPPWAPVLGTSGGREVMMRIALALM